MDWTQFPEQRFNPGQYIFREDDRGELMYIIESGEIKIGRSARGDVPLATLGVGDFFGEMAILEDQPRFASASAMTHCVLRCVSREQFSLLFSDVETTVRLMRKLTGRLRRVEHELQSVVAHQKAAPRASLPDRGDAEPTKRVSAQAPALKPDFKLVHGQSGGEYALRPGLVELMVGRPDPVTGTTPELNLGGLDTQRTLSRRHAKLLFEGTEMFLREEVGVTNGTFVNGRRLRTGVAQPVVVGDMLRFGAIEVQLERT